MSNTAILWAALSCVAALLTVCMTLLIYMLAFAHRQGRNDQRMDGFETRLVANARRTEELAKGHGAMLVTIERMCTQMESVIKTGDEIKGMLSDVLTDRVRPRRAALSIDEPG